MAYTPAGVLTSTGSIGHKATVYYDRVAMDNLKKALRFFSLVEPRRLPRNSGLTSQMFRYIPFAANTTGGSEGTIGTSIAITTETVSVTVVQYFDFVNFSDLYLESIIDDSLTNSAEELGYRAGLTVDTLIRIEFDAGSATTSTTLVGSALGANDYRKMVQLLRGTDVKPKEGGDFLSLAHPYVIYDLISDSSTGGFIDVNHGVVTALYAGTALEPTVRDLQGDAFESSFHLHPCQRKNLLDWPISRQSAQAASPQRLHAQLAA